MIKRITGHFYPKFYVSKCLLVLIAFLGLYLLFAWSSYSPLDSSWAVSSSQHQTINKAGSLGAWIIDLFFVLFGQVGNIFPFIIFFLPLYWIKTKKIPHFSLAKLSFHLFGFAMLLCGLTVLASFLLSSTPYYLSGGVLGGFLVQFFFPKLDFVGVILGAVIFTVVGFICCSGQVLIGMLFRFYRWLTMTNNDQLTDENVQPEAVDQQQFELEEIIVDKSAMEREQNVQFSEHSSNIVNVESFVDISGLDENTHKDQENSLQIKNLHLTDTLSTNEICEDRITRESQLSDHIKTSEDHVLNFTKTLYSHEQHDELPNVSLEANNMPKASKIAHTQEQDATTLSHVLPISYDSSPLNVSIPLKQKTDEKITALIKDSNQISIENFEQLATQFDNLEKQRLIEMEKQSEVLDAKDALAWILSQSSDTVDTQDNKFLQTAETEENLLSTPKYKSYGETLIHPALQKKITVNNKPTTPLPSLDLLEHRLTVAQEITREELVETSRNIEQQLRNFNIKATVKNALVGPVVTRYELELQPGVKAAKVTNIDRDLARALMFRSIRVAEVIAGKPYIGIETPNVKRQIVPLRDVLDSREFKEAKSPLSMALGKDISGNPVIVDLAKMPHLLVAGSTGSGKSVGVNTMILSLLFRVQPEQVKFIMIDPKVVELSIYNGIPHLLTEVVTDMKKAANALRWCVDEMERRYQLLSALRVRNIEGYNDKIDEYERMNMPIPNPIWRPGDTMDTLPPPLQKLTYIVVIVDEFADLMMVAGKQVEELIARLAQKARAIGIHLILATQRPSVDVITGLIKANIPSRIAFTVASKIDSRTILDQGGAEALLGRGDMLYSGQGSSELIRVHGAFMSDDEVSRVADDWRARGKPDYIESILDGADENDDKHDRTFDNDELDDLFDQVMEFVISTGTTSTSAVQRRFRVGFNRAGRIMDQLEQQGIVSPLQNGKREILAHRTEY